MAKRSNSTTDTFYLHKDQQGSTTAITNAAGTIVQQLMYDPWGKQFQVNNSILTYSSPAQSKGYTGHEMVNDFEVIHMGGRTYNPTLGRFMQADPFIQQPTNLQSYNRYAYVQNNPMSYTDPSGYFFKKLFNVIKENWRSLASIAVGYFTFGLGTGVWNLAQMGTLQFGTAVGWGAIAGATSGFVATGSLKGALSGAISGAAFGALGGLGLNGVENFAASGLLGGVLTDIQGGKFGHGFVSAGIGAVAGGKFGANPYAQVIGAAVVGGTVSAITGGKFANGAMGAAFAATLRADWGDSPMQGDGANFDENDEIIGDARNSFDREFNELQEKVSKLTPFSGDAAKADALKWLHENVHPLSVKYDVEINSNLTNAFDGRVWRIDSIGTSYNRHGVSINASALKGDYGRTKWKWGANWHSHAKGYNPSFSNGDNKIMNLYKTHGLSWHMSYQDSNGSRLVNK